VPEVWDQFAQAHPDAPTPAKFSMFGASLQLGDGLIRESLRRATSMR
jgi:hypothetical protein